MQEIIGNITLDYTYYPGEDLYSDGVVEDELLKIAMDSREGEFNQVIAEKKSWPVMYHFSHIRQNIVEWLPIRQSDSVLEIGSGCGAITGVLAEKAGKVRCIELSKKRSYINAYRNRNHDNIRIEVGNFQDIEKNLTETFDYITLIGVFEYSAGYIGGEEPYVEMLKKISRHLNPGGKIVIAIENRLGLKYWAGCREDHAGLCFEGLEGYHQTEGVRTFSKRELEKVIRAAGTFDTAFYYPYPDYKFPMVIYSDKRLPLAGELNQNICNFDRSRLQVFDETKVYDTLLDSELFPEFSNSFLTVLTIPGKEKEEEQIVYAKYSNERSKDYAIRTDLLEKSGVQRLIQKSAWTTEAVPHIERLIGYEKALGEQYKSSTLHVNSCEAGTGSVRFEYLQGRTLEEEIDTLVGRKKFAEAKQLFLKYLNLVKTTGEMQKFQMTQDFCEVFGDDCLQQLPKDLKALNVTDIDMVLANILVTEDGWNLIDYEWTFSFPIPVNFVLFRIIHYYMERGGRSRWEGFEDWNLYQDMEISKEEIDCYQCMENHFQKWIQGEHVPIRDLYGAISPGVMNVYTMAKEQEEKLLSERLQVFYAGEEEFQEEQSCYYPMTDGEIKICLSLPEKVKKIRLDPCSYAGLLTIRHLRFISSDQAVSFVTNGFCLEGNRVSFGTMDPQLLIMEVPQEATALELEFQMDRASEKVGDFLTEMQRLPGQQKAEIEALKAEIERKEQLITAMENTKVWKAYRKIKGVSGKGE